MFLVSGVRPLESKNSFKLFKNSGLQPDIKVSFINNPVFEPAVQLPLDIVLQFVYTKLFLLMVIMVF